MQRGINLQASSMQRIKEEKKVNGLKTCFLKSTHGELVKKNIQPNK